MHRICAGWFFGAPFESIKRGNVLDLVAYGFYTRRLDQLTQEVCCWACVSAQAVTWALLCEVASCQGLEMHYCSRHVQPHVDNTALYAVRVCQSACACHHAAELHMAAGRL